MSGHEQARFRTRLKMRKYPEGLDALTAIDVYRTHAGWTFFGQSHTWNTGRDGLVRGEPGSGLIDLLIREEVVYPAQLPDALAWLWDRSAELSSEQLGVELQRVADWVSTCELSVPLGGAFAGFFNE